MWDPFVQCVKSFVSGRDGGFITRNNFRNGERTEPAYSRSFNPLLKNRSYPRHGMRVGSNGRNSSRSSQSVERETMCYRWKIASRKNENARNELPRSFEIIGSRHAGRAKGASRYRHETIAINQTPCILLRRFKFPPRRNTWRWWWWWCGVRDTSQSTPADICELPAIRRAVDYRKSFQFTRAHVYPRKHEHYVRARKKWEVKEVRDQRWFFRIRGERKANMF